MKLNRHNVLFAAVASMALAACDEAGPSLTAAEIDQATACALDGMLLADYPGPKAQIHFAGQSGPDFFCDTMEMFSIYLNPEQVRNVKALYVQDMGVADWNEPKGAWIDAKNAFFVVGSKLHGSMGPTFASFAQESAATKFITEHGGKVYRFAEITPQMVALDGGALHDMKM